MESGSSRDPGCAHGLLWLARDQVWRCEACDPPVFEAEVIDRRTQQELLRLFDLEQLARRPAA